MKFCRAFSFSVYSWDLLNLIRVKDTFNRLFSKNETVSVKYWTSYRIREFLFSCLERDSDSFLECCEEVTRQRCSPNLVLEDVFANIFMNLTPRTGSLPLTRYYDLISRLFPHVDLNQFIHTLVLEKTLPLMAEKLKVKDGDWQVEEYIILIVERLFLEMMNQATNLVFMNCSPVSWQNCEYGDYPVWFSAACSVSQTICSDYVSKRVDVVDRELSRALESRRRDIPELSYELKNLNKSIIGQQNAISAIYWNLELKMTGREIRRAPLVYLFIGPSGVGKTELARQIAQILHFKNYRDLENSQKLKVFNMAQFQEAEDAVAFYGPRQGLEGSGDLTKVLLQNPTAVIILDEIEKAHPSIAKVLLSMFDENGSIYDTKTKTNVDTTRATFILTSNLCSSTIARVYGETRWTIFGRKEEEMKEKYEKIKGLVTTELRSAVIGQQRNFLKDPELRGRVTETVIFLPLTQTEMEVIINQRLLNLARVFVDKREYSYVNLFWDASVAKYFASSYSDAALGFRPVIRHLENEITKLLVDGINQKKLDMSAKIYVFVKSKNLDFVTTSYSDTLKLTKTQRSQEQPRFEEVEKYDETEEFQEPRGVYNLLHEFEYQRDFSFIYEKKYLFAVLLAVSLLLIYLFSLSSIFVSLLPSILSTISPFLLGSGAVATSYYLMKQYPVYAGVIIFSYLTYLFLSRKSTRELSLKKVQQVVEKIRNLENEDLDLKFQFQDLNEKRETRLTRFLTRACEDDPILASKLRRRLQKK